MKYFNLRETTFLMLLVVGLSLCSCGSDPDHDILHEASDIHNAAVKVESELKPQLQSLTSLRTMLEAQEEMSPEDSNMVSKIKSIEQSHAWWQENHVEVPGFGHDGHDHSGHDHSGHDHSGHDHDHGPALEVTASDMLLLQKEFRDTIFSIRDRVANLKD